MGKVGNWRRGCSLGEGGQGRTYIAYHVSDGREAVLKELRNADSAQARDRFRREYQAVEKLNHPGIPRVLDKDLDALRPYIVFERREGRNLAVFVQENRTAADLMNVMAEVYRIMEFVHFKGVCHRDLKPEHVIIGDDRRVSIIDFGLVFCDDAGRATMTAELVGSRFYMAPEMEDGRGEVTWSCDVYALGKLTYFALSGGRCFNREKHRAQNFNLVHLHHDARYEQINKLLDRMIAQDPTKRFQNAHEALVQLENTVQYFGAVEWERSFTLKEGELRQHKQAWSSSDGGWFTNDGHESEDWSVFGPYRVEPPLPVGLYEAVFVLRATKRGGNPANGHAVIDVAGNSCEAQGASGTAIFASRRLAPEDLVPSSSEPDGWREHSILFFYDGRREIEFRILPSKSQSGVSQGTYTLQFHHVTVRRLSSLQGFH